MDTKNTKENDLIETQWLITNSNASRYQNREKKRKQNGRDKSRDLRRALVVTLDKHQKLTRGFNTRLSTKP